MKIKSFKPKQGTNLNYTSDFPPSSKLKIIPLGGVGDVTKNMYVYEYGNDIVIIDCGVGFPDEQMLGIDLVIPDVTYLRERKSKIRGIVITHAHDDHIGGLPYIWPELDVPIYSQNLSTALLKAKFTEFNLTKDKINTLKVNDSISLGCFNISFYQVSHSIPDSTGIILRTPVGTIIHQSDFKIDWTPVNGQTTDVSTLARVGAEGVLLMAIDCLRSEKAGYTLTEKTIEPTFTEVEQNTKGKVLITMTSSNITRIQQAINVAQKTGRKLALSGRSLDVNFQVARDLGYLDVPPGLIIAQEEIKRFSDEKLMVLVAGAQGQPGSALSRVANGDHKYVFLKKDDAVVFSADPIPSTESAQNALIDTLSLIGCKVYYSALTSDLHVSGHASQEELKLMLALAKPKYVFPIGGTYKQMAAFAEMTRELGFLEDKCLLLQNGDVIEVSKDKVLVNGSIEVNNVYVDGLGVGDVGNVVLRDRQLLSEDGVVVVVVTIKKQTGQIIGNPDIISRGFVYEKESEGLLESAGEFVKGLTRSKNQGSPDWRYIRRSISENLEQFFYEQTNRRPMVLTVLVDL